LFAVLALALLLVASSVAYAQPPPTLLWSDPTDTLAIALSANGQYVVVGTFLEVRFYSRSSSTPLWIYSELSTFTSVAISADGSYVAAGSFGGVYFWANAKSLTGNPAPTWTSAIPGGSIEHRCLAISDDGNYVAACGTGPNVFYWAGAAGMTGSNIATTWDFSLAAQVEAIALSDDGNHVAAVGFSFNAGGVLGYWNNAISLTGHNQQPTWRAQEPNEQFVDVAISDDGNYVAVAGLASTATIFYWANAITRTGTSEPHTWAGGVDVPFASVDISCDGDSVIAGAEVLIEPSIGGAGVAVAGASADGINRGSVYFWGAAQGLSGSPLPTWVYPTPLGVADVAINDAGTYMAAVTSNLDTLYFFDKQGNLLWQDVDIRGDKLSISCDGGTLAVGTPGPLTAYLFDTGFSTPCCGVEAVGGTAMPVNILATLGPWLVVVGLVGCIGTAVVVAKKRRP
jgi:WD40 repeat protein